ncbi:hypothetical protein KY362_08145 [Candidatus Woesearchaeota archaeon]|nr:hypothetical protein [Candidatus Woesearchaeota archaeon]
MTYPDHTVVGEGALPDDFALRAYELLFPDATKRYFFKVEYSGRIRDYGANVEMSAGWITFKMSRKWYPVSPEIQMGLMQELLLKLFRKRGESFYIDLYNNFVKNLHIAVPKDKIDPELEESFTRVNDRYFLGLVEMPNLRWGKFATTTYGSYDFKKDTITISSVFKDVEESKYVDYIMFHEMLHKQRKFRKSGSKTYYHDKKFKNAERVFEDGHVIEKELGSVVRREKAKAYYRARAERPKKKMVRQPKKSGIFKWF